MISWKAENNMVITCMFIYQIQWGFVVIVITGSSLCQIIQAHLNANSGWKNTFTDRVMIPLYKTQESLQDDSQCREFVPYPWVWC